MSKAQRHVLTVIIIIIIIIIIYLLLHCADSWHVSQEPIMHT